MNENQTNGEVQRSELERDQAAALGCTAQGEEKSVQRPIVRFRGFRCRVLDDDNFSGGCKDLLDGLRHAGIICGDSPDEIDFQPDQVKVSTRAEERTEITIEYP